MISNGSGFLKRIIAFCNKGCIKSFEGHWIWSKYISDLLAQYATYIRIILYKILNSNLIDFFSCSNLFIAQWVVIFVDESALDTLFSWLLNKRRSILGNKSIKSVFTVVQLLCWILIICLFPLFLCLGKKSRTTVGTFFIYSKMITTLYMWRRWSMVKSLQAHSWLY